MTVKRPVRDSYGTITGEATHAVPGCFDWPTTSSESSRSFTQVTSGRVLTAPPGADIVTDDTLTYPNGDRWHVVGDPYDWQNPHTARRPGLQVTLERVR